MNPVFIAYPPVSDLDYVRESDPDKFPRRTTEAEVAVDVQRAWHNPGADRHAQHLIAYRIDGDTVRPLRVGIHRHLEVRTV